MSTATTPIKVGDRIPNDVSFLNLKDGAPRPLSRSDVFDNKRVVLFAVPGAFTPGCSKTHCPSYVADANRLKQKGIDHIYCTAVNDAYVLHAWGASQNVGDKITFLADGNADFAKKIGLVKETGPFGGTRSARYALIVNNGTVEHVAVDEKEIKDTTADALLSHL